MGMSRENPDEILDEIDMEDESTEQLFNEAFSSKEEARKITDWLHEPGVSPPIPTYYSVTLGSGGKGKGGHEVVKKFI